MRPHDSATAESGTIASASVRVVADSARLEVDAATPNCVASVGRSPCTAYTNTNVAMPAHHIARPRRRKPTEPRS